MTRWAAQRWLTCAIVCGLTSSTVAISRTSILDRSAENRGPCPMSSIVADIVEAAAMKRVLILACVAFGLNPGDAARAADQPLVLDVWPGKAAGDHGQIGPERVRAAAEAPTKDAKWITNVTRPTISVFRPDAGNNCPGRDGDLPGRRVLEPGVGQGGRGGGGAAQYAGHHGGGPEVSRAATPGRAGAAARRRGRCWMRSGRSAWCAAGQASGGSTRSGSGSWGSRPAGIWR